MAPIDPNQILKAFEPVVSEVGGIKSVKEVPKLSGFLNNDGWHIINDWLKDSKEKQNFSFILELIKVLDKCPISTERLKLNDTPKLLKTLVKSENNELATKAKMLRSKWKEQVKNENEVQNEMQKEVQNEIDNSDNVNKEKRKLKDSSNSNRDDKLNGIKKLKTKDENVSLNSLNDHEAQIKKPVDDSASNNDTKSAIKTAKFKLGKMRSIGLLDKEKDTTKLNLQNGLNNLSKGTKLVNNTASTPSPKLNVICKNTAANKGGIQLIDAQPLPDTELMSNSSSHHQTKHIIKESASFMDAISSVPSTPKLKKKKKIDKVTTDKSNNKPTKQQDDHHELNQMDFDSSIGDLSNSVNERMTDENNSMESTTTNDDDKFLTFNNESPFDPNRNPIKGILLLVPKANRRRSIQWPDDDKLEKVKFFETDDKERCNVYKQQQNFDQHRKDEAVQERAMNVMGKSTPKTINSPGVCLIPWKLYPINFDGVDRFLNQGQSSVEKIEQSKRLKNVLEDIDLLFNRNDPKEPSDIDSNGGSTDYVPPTIPLEDDNNMIIDCSNRTYSVNGIKPVILAPNVQVFNPLMNSPVSPLDPLNSYTMNNAQLNNLNYNHQMIHSPTLYSQQPQIYNGNWTQNGSVAPVQQMMNQQHMQTDPQWTSSNWNSVANNSGGNNNQTQLKHNNNYHGNNQHHKNKHNNYKKQISQNQNAKKQTPLCRYFQNGDCRNGSSCTFLHSK